MCARIFFISVFVFVDGVSVQPYRETPDIKSYSKVELAPILITSGLNDIVVLSAPIVKTEAIIYLHNPNGDAIPVEFKKTKTLNNFIDSNNLRDTEGPTRFRIFNVNYNTSCNDTKDVFAEEETKMHDHDFMIGPLREADHGNWVLSMYYEDVDGRWIEMFQVITIEIIEIVPLFPEKAWLDLGTTFILSFAYPLSNLESCQVIPPKTTFDRFYDRNLANSNKCEFVMKNVTLQDQGTWTIIGVGKIVYKGSSFLRVRGVVK